MIRQFDHSYTSRVWNGWQYQIRAFQVASRVLIQVIDRENCEIVRSMISPVFSPPSYQQQQPGEDYAVYRLRYDQWSIQYNDYLRWYAEDIMHPFNRLVDKYGKGKSQSTVYAYWEAFFKTNRLQAAA